MPPSHFEEIPKWNVNIICPLGFQSQIRIDKNAKFENGESSFGVIHWEDTNRNTLGTIMSLFGMQRLSKFIFGKISESDRPDLVWRYSDHKVTVRKYKTFIKFDAHDTVDLKWV